MKIRKVLNEGEHVKYKVFESFIDAAMRYARIEIDDASCDYVALENSLYQAKEKAYLILKKMGKGGVDNDEFDNT